MSPKILYLVCAIPIMPMLLLAQKASAEDAIRVVKRTAMIERGREIIMEEVVFSKSPEKTTAKQDSKNGRAIARGDRTMIIDTSPRRSFTVNPVLHPNGLSLVTWWSNQSDGDPVRHQCWSNLPWAILGMGISFTENEVQYSALCLVSTGNFDTDLAGVANLRAAPASLLSFPEMAPSFQLVSPGKVTRYQPDPVAMKFIRDLHHHFSRNHRSLKDDHESTKRDQILKAEKREAEKQQPKDLVIRFGIRPVKETENSTKSNR